MNNSKNFRSALVAGLALLAVGQAKAQTITRTIDFEYDAYGAVIKQTVEPDDPTLKSVTDFVLHPNYGVTTGKTLSWTDPVTGQPKSRGESVGYDARYRYAESNTNAKGHVTTSTHDAATGNVLTSTDPDQLVTTLAYDPWGRKLRETRPDGTATSTAYRSCVDTCLNGASSVTITQHWGGAGQASQTAVPTEEFTDALGRTVLTRSWGFDGTAILNEKVYDSLGRVLKIARPHYSTQTAVWTFYDQRDALGRLTQSRSPNKTGTGFDTTTYAYNGLTLTTTNAKSQTRSALHNLLGKTKAVTDAYNAVTSYAYDPFGNLVRTTDAKGNQINIGYDKLGRKTTLSDPSLGNWTYVVDALGQTMRQTDAKQQVTDFEFDALGRMTRRLERDLDSRWEYDTAAKGTGDLAEAYTWAGGAKDYRRVHSYDAYGRPNCTVISLDWDYSSCVSYDAFGRAQTISQLRSARGSGTSGAVGNSFTTRYNAQGYANQVDRYDGATSMVWQAQAVDAEGNTTQEQLGNGVVTQRGYNLYTGRLNTVQSGPAANNPVYQNDVYEYDALGNLESRSQLTANSGSLLSETFSYDKLNRLETSSIGGSLRSTTTYDEIGNLTSKTGVGTYNYPASGAGSVRPSAVSSITGTPAGLTNPGFQYDANGNLVNGLARGYAWTSFNMPASIDKLSGSTPTQRTAFVYSSEHERTRQTISPVSGGAAGSATTVIWYGAGIEKELDTIANTTTIRTRLPRGLGFIEEKFSGLTVATTATATRGVRYVLKDHLGSPLVTLDQAQVVLQRMSFDAWGRRRNADGSDDAGPLWGSLKNTQDHGGYTGHEHLDQLELVHMNARMYDPLVGRHTSADPTVPDLGNGQSLNRYAYVLNNALMFIDPTGLGPKADEMPSTVSDKPPQQTLEEVEVKGRKGVKDTVILAGVSFVRSSTGRMVMSVAGRLALNQAIGGCIKNALCTAVVVIGVSSYAASPTLRAKVDGATQEAVSRIMNAVTGGDENAEASADSNPSPSKGGKTDGEKKPPNPNGRNGGPEHQEGVKQAEQELREKYANDPNIEIRTEVRVRTPGGEKENRFIDVAAVDKRTGQVVDGVQVGRETRAGNPVAREQRAINDIQGASPTTNIDFLPYNR